MAILVLGSDTSGVSVDVSARSGHSHGDDSVERALDRLRARGHRITGARHAVIDDSLAGEPSEFVAEFVILRIMNVEALDHDAALAGIEGRAGEQLGRYFLWIDIVEHKNGEAVLSQTVNLLVLRRPAKN